MRIGDPRDVLAGAMFAAFGLAGLILSARYGMGTAARMGPGYLPVVLSGGLVLLGLTIAIRGLLFVGDGGASIAISPRAVICIIGSVVVFAFLLSRLGLLAAITGLVVVSSLARANFRLTTIASTTLVLSLLSVALFVWLLQVQVPLWPELGLW